MNKKHYNFLILIIILSVLIYNILSYKYYQYKIQKYNTSISQLNIDIKKHIENAQKIIEYKKSRAYKNKILKQDKWLKNKAELITYITTEDKYNKYIKHIDYTNRTKNEEKHYINKDTYWMTVYQKWVWLIFKKDLR